MRITDRIPPFKRSRPLWETSPRRFESLAILAGRAESEKVGAKTDDLNARRKAFDRGVRQFNEQTRRARAAFTRFRTTPDWEGHRNACAGAAECLK